MPSALLRGEAPPRTSFLRGEAPAAPRPPAVGSSFLRGQVTPVAAAPPPSAGPLDPRPAARVLGQIAGAIIPDPVKDVVGWIGHQFATRLGALGEVVANPLLPQNLSPEVIRGWIQSYPYLDPSERAAVESWGPARAEPPRFAWPGPNEEPVYSAIPRRLWQLIPALTMGKTPAGEPPNVQAMLAERGFTEPFGPPRAAAEATNRANLGLPVGSALRAATSPEAVALAIESAGAPVLNRVGSAVLPLPLEAGRQVLNLEGRLPQALAKVPVKRIAEQAGKPFRTRALPGVQEALEFFGPEKSLPNRFRSTIEEIQRRREGQASLREFKRTKLLGDHGTLPEAVQDRIATAIEKRDIGSLVPAEQDIARKIVLANRGEVVARRSVGIKKFELGGHLPGMERKWRGAEAAKTRAGITLSDFKALQEELPKAVRTTQRLGARARVAQKRYLETGQDFQKMQDVKRLHADAIREERAIRSTLRGYPRVAATAYATGKRAGELKQRFTQAGGFQPQVGFTKRVLTPEKRLEAKIKPYGSSITPSGLGTGKMQRRLSDVSKTTEDINLESIQKHGYRAFEPVVQATMKSGLANDTRVMNAGILTDAVKAFGAPAAKGERVLADIYGTKAGFNRPMQRLLERTKVPDEVHEYLDRLNHHLTPERYGRWINGVRAVNNQFKKWALFSPGFVARNIQNNIVQTGIYGNTDLKNWTEAFHLRRKLGRAKTLDDLKGIYVHTGRGGTIRANEYLASAIRRGVIGRGQSAVETGKQLTEGKYNLFKRLRGGNEFAEDVSRLSFDLHLQRSGLGPNAAAKKVDQVLFNYSPRFSSKGFQRVRRYGIPFVNWLSQITPLVVRSALERPGSIGLIQSGIEKQNIAQGFTPELTAKLGKDIQDQGGIVIGRTLEGKIRIVKPTGYGSYDANSLLAPVLNKDVVGMVDELASRGYPQINVPYSLLRGKDLLTGADLTGKPVPGPPALKMLFLHPKGKAWAEKHGIFQDARDPGIIRVSDRMNVILRSVPPLRLASVMADIIKPDKGAGRRAASFVGGVSEVERSPEQQNFFQMKDTKEGLTEAMGILRRYPPPARWQVAQQFPPAVRRVLMARGIIHP